MKKVLECGERNGTAGDLFLAVSRTEPSVNPPALTISENASFDVRKLPHKFAKFKLVIKFYEVIGNINLNPCEGIERSCEGWQVNEVTRNKHKNTFVK